MLIGKDGNDCLIFKKYTLNDEFCSYCNFNNTNNFGWDTKKFRHATEEEKQILFDKMAEESLRWNAEEKRVEKIRWKPNYNDMYFYLNDYLIVYSCSWGNIYTDQQRYKAYNCFRTGQQAEQAAQLVKETLRKFHEEND